MERGMIFVCSKEAILLFVYGAKSDDSRVVDLARLVVIIGGMSSVKEPFEIDNDDITLICKPFLLHNSLFYVVVQRSSSSCHLVAHLVGYAVVNILHGSMTLVLEHVEKATSSAIHSSTFSESMGGDTFTIDDALSALFDEDSVKDEYLTFEEHFLREASSTSAALFADLILTLEGGCVYMFETFDASPSNSFHLLFASNGKCDEMQPSLDPYRNRLVMDYARSPIIVFNAPHGGTYRDASVVLFPDGTGMIMCAVTDTLVLVATTVTVASSSNLISDISGEVREVPLESLPAPLHSAWMASCARVRRAFPTKLQLESHGSVMEKISYILD